MTHTFFTVARQGNNSWKHYLKSGFIIVGMMFAATTVAMVALAITTDFSLEDSENITPYIAANPLHGLVVYAALAIGILVGLVIAVERVHQRQVLTLLNPQATFNWQRILQGLGVWIAISAGTSGILYLFNPSRYEVSFVATEWIPGAIAYLLAMMPLIFVIMLLIYGYVLQAIGLLIRRPIWLLTVWSIVFSAPIFLDAPQQGFLTVLPLVFYAVLIYQDDGLALVIGLTMAVALMGDIVFGVSDAIATTQPPIATSTLFTITKTLPAGFRLFLFIVQSSLFYYLCFRKSPKHSRKNTI